MPEKTPEQMLADLWRSWFGVIGTEDKGAIHTLHALEDMIPDVQKNTIWRKVMAAAFVVQVSLLGTLIGISLTT